MIFRDALYEMCKGNKVCTPDMDGYWYIAVTGEDVRFKEHENATGIDIDIRMNANFFPVVEKFASEDWMLYDLSLKDMIEKKKEWEKEKNYRLSLEGMIAARKACMQE